MATNHILKDASGVSFSALELMSRKIHEKKLARVDRKDKIIHLPRSLVIEVLVVFWITYTEMADKEAAVALCPHNKAGEVMYRKIFPVAIISEISCELTSDGMI